MAHIDKFIQAVLSKPGAQLRFQAGAEPLLVLGGRSAPLMAKKASAGQIRNLLAEVMQPGHRAMAEKTDAVEFRYQPPNLAVVTIAVEQWSGEVGCTVRAAGAGEADEFDLTSALAIPRAAEPSIAPASPQRDADIPAVIAPPSPYAATLLSAAGSASVSATGPTLLATHPSPVAASPLASHAATDAGSEAEPVRPSGEEPVIDKLFRVMVGLGSSDLHLTAGEIPMVRKDGDMVRLPNQPRMSSEQLERLLDPITPERNRNEFRDSGDTDFAYEIKGLARFRANRFRDRTGVGAVFRTIPAVVVTADQLGLSQAEKDFCMLSKGLVLVTGPTGSGKSTTLAGMIDLINRTRGGHIITVEDPIEFVHENKKALINQREVSVHTQSFKRALRAALREDPDIVLVGEMRDLETISIAIETAETGHLVFGTLHTTTAYSTIDRIIDQFPTDQQEQIRVMLSESLKGVIAQTLCKKLKGGRAAAREILVVTKAVSNLIREGKTFQIPSIMQTSKNIGMKLMNEALLELVKGGVIAVDEAYLKSVDKQNFVTMANQMGLKVET